MLGRTHRRSDVGRTHVANILDAALSPPRARLLLNDAHDASLSRAVEAGRWPQLGPLSEAAEGE